MLLGIAYASVVFQGRSLVYSDNLNPVDFRFTAENYGTGFVPPSQWASRNLLVHANFHDPGATWWQWEPAGEFLRKAIADREWPFWDPLVAAGTPAMANLTSTFFFPPYFFLVLLGNGAALKNFYFLLLLGGAGWFTYALLRRSSLQRLPSFLGAAAFMLSGALGKNVGSFMGQTLCCLPFLMYMTRRFADEPTWRWSGLLAISFACVSLSSFPPLLFGVFGMTTLFFIVITFMPGAESDPRRWRTASRFAVAALLGLGLVGVYYGPAFSALADSPQVKAAYTDAASETLSASSFFELLAPGVVGGRDIFADPPVNDPTYNRDVPYLGVIALLLACLAGLGSREPRLRVLAWTVSAATALVALKLVGLAPVQWIAALPGFKSIHFAVYFGNLLDFSLAVLAAVGLNRVMSGTLGRLRPVGAVVIIISAVLGFRVLAQGLQKPGNPHAGEWQPLWWMLLATALVGGLLTLASMSRRGSRHTHWIALALIALACGEGIRNTTYPRQYMRDVWRHPPLYIQNLAAIAASGRVLSYSTFSANAGSAFGIFELDSLMAFNPPRIFALYKRYAAPSATLFLREASLLPPEGVLDRADIQALVVVSVREDIAREAIARGYELRWSDGYIQIFSRPGSPRYFFTSTYRTVPDPAAALELLGKLGAGRELVLESPPGPPSQPNRSDDPPVRVLDFRRNSVKVSVTAPRAGLVYFSESHHSGWSATVNGRLTEILPANYAFRAVAVPAGSSEVEMVYTPPGLVLGAALTGISALLVLGLVVAGSDRRTRRDAVPSGLPSQEAGA